MTEFPVDIQNEIETAMESGDVQKAQRLILDELDRQGDKSLAVAIHRLHKASKALEEAVVEAFSSLGRGAK